jgi:hypothetical protein
MKKPSTDKLNVKTPKVVEDVGRDLRDRGLLPVVLVLAVALIAIPVLLGGSDPAPQPSATATSAAANEGAVEAPEAQAVVLAENPGLRDFRKRLDSFQRRNPFRQQLTKPPGGSLGDSATLEDSTAGTGSTDGGGLDTGDAGTIDSPPVTDDVGSNPPGGSDGGAPSEPVDNDPPPVPDPEYFVFSWEVDVKAGPVGDVEQIDGVKPLQFIPDGSAPIAQFLQGNGNADEALFIVSREVVDTEGEGKCAPSLSACEYLLLKEGEEHRFDYGPDGETYRIKLRDVRLEQTKVDPEELSADRIFEQVSGYTGLTTALLG